MKAQFNRMRKDEDDEMVVKFEKTRKSSLDNFDAIYSEYLARVKYNDRDMVEKLRNMVLRKISDESEEIKMCIIDNKLFDIKSESVDNLHNRINQFSNVCIKTLANDTCEQILKQGITDSIVQVYKTNARGIENCQKDLKIQFNDIGIMQKRWFDPLVDSKSVQEKYVTRLATCILRLLNGMVHYGTTLGNFTSKSKKLM